MVTKEETLGRMMKWEVRIDIHALLYMESMNNKSLLYSIGNPTQFSVVTYIGKESEKGMDICIYKSLCCTSKTNTTV